MSLFRYRTNCRLSKTTSHSLLLQNSVHPANGENPRAQCRILSRGQGGWDEGGELIALSCFFSTARGVQFRRFSFPPLGRQDATGSSVFNRQGAPGSSVFCRQGATGSKIFSLYGASGSSVFCRLRATGSSDFHRRGSTNSSTAFTFFSPAVGALVKCYKNFSETSSLE